MAFTFYQFQTGQHLFVNFFVESTVLTVSLCLSEFTPLETVFKFAVAYFLKIMKIVDYR